MNVDIHFEYCSSFFLDPKFNGYKLKYHSHVMGTSFGVYAKFEFLENSFKTDKETLNFGFLSDEFKKAIAFENEIATKKTQTLNKSDEYDILSLYIGIKGVSSGSTTYQTTINFENPITTINKMGLVVNRKLFPLAEPNEKSPIVNGVFDSAFYFRDGTLYVERKQTEISDDTEDVKRIAAFDDNIHIASPGGWCKTSNIKFIIS